MVEVEWANAEKNIIRWKFTQPWTWDEFYLAQKQVDAMIDSVTGIVDSIFLTSRTQLLPPNATIHLRRIIAQRHARHNLVVMVGANRFLSALMQIMTRWLPDFASQIRYTLSEAEAFATIAISQQKKQQIERSAQTAR